MNHLPSIPGSLRLLISGGDVLRAHHVNHLLDKAEVYNTYGPSETTVCASYYRCRDGQILEDGTYPIGRPVLGAEIRILDAEGNEVKKGEIGEICIYGNGVSRGCSHACKYCYASFMKRFTNHPEPWGSLLT